MPLPVIATISVGSVRLLGATDAGGDLGRRLATAVAYFMAERDTAKPGWVYPEFRRLDGQGRRSSYEMLIDEGLWSRFGAEADRQGVSTDRLLEHALLYLSAQQDSGALAERLGRDIG